MSRLTSEPHQTRQVLFESCGISVVDFCCRAPFEQEGPEEPNPTHSIVLVRRGVFGRAHRRDTLLADPNHILYFNAGEPYRYSHPLPGGDDCTILAVETRLALELVARHAPREAADERTPFRRGHALSGSWVARLHYQLLHLLRRRGADLPLEDVLSELADESVRAAYREDGSRPDGRAASANVRRRRRDIVEAAKLAINERLDSPPSLGQMAVLFDCSPFYLSRIFREIAGVSLRRYCKRLRVRAAADRLAGGAPDLTRLGLDLGYSDHSHFTNTFHREWGMPPSRFRALMSQK